MSNFSFAETEYKDIFLVFVTFVVIVMRVEEFVAIRWDLTGYSII